MDRQCMREEYEEMVMTGYGHLDPRIPYILKIWTFHYSDGDIETVTVKD